MTQEKIIDMIKKLLALGGNNPSKEEANAAIAKANELMLRHNITTSQLEKKDLGDYEDREMKTQGITGTRLIQQILKEFFFVDILIYARQKKWTVVGSSMNVEIAIYMFWHIKQKFDDAWKQYRELADDLMNHSKSDYYVGLYHGLRDKLTEERNRLNQEEGLVWLGDPNIKKYQQEKWGKQLVRGDASRKMAGFSSGDNNAADHGYHQGRNMTLQHGMKSGMKKQNLLGGN